MLIKNTILFSIIIFLFSCNEALDGKIEYRTKDRIYLVNKSKTKQLKITIKKTIVTNDSLYDYETKIIELAPGDERYLGNTSEYKKQHPIEEIVVDTLVVYKPDFDPNKPYTAIDDDKPVNYIQYKYEVTGQLEVKLKPKTEK